MTALDFTAKAHEAMYKAWWPYGRPWEKGDSLAPPVVDTPYLHAEIDGYVGIITLQNQPKRNVLNRAVLGGIVEFLEWFEAECVRAVVIRAKADAKVWSAGHDITEFQPWCDPLPDDGPLEKAIDAIRRFPAPVIAAVRGSVWGGAFDLVLSCDMVIADPTATFAMTPANLGIPYNAAGLRRFAGRLHPNIVKQLFFTAEEVDAESALAWGIINRLVNPRRLDDEAMRVANQIAEKAPLAIASIKDQLRVIGGYPHINPATIDWMQHGRHRAYHSADYREGLAAFAEKRKPEFKGV